MTDSIRLQAFTSLGLTSLGLLFAPLGNTAEPTRIPPVLVEWNDEVNTPAICLGNSQWFVSIIPSVLTEIENLEAPVLKHGETKMSGTFLHVDRQSRLCVLKTEGALGVQPIALASGPGPRAGLNLECYYSDATCQSTVAGKDRHYRGEILPRPLLRIRVADALHFCHVGAPLINEKGEIEGILTERDLAMKEEAHAIPASQLRKLILDLERYQRSGPVWVGLIFHSESSTPIVLDVKPNSPASEAGIQPGDVILDLNHGEIEDLNDLVEAIYDLPAGENATVRILRGLDQVSLDVMPTFAETAAREP